MGENETNVERMAKLEKSVENIEKLMNKIDRKLDELPSRTELSALLDKRDTEIEGLKNRTGKLEDHVTWLWRTVLGGLVLAFVSGLVGLLFWVIQGK